MAPADLVNFTITQDGFGYGSNTARTNSDLVMIRLVFKSSFFGSEVFWTTNHRQPHLIETNSDPTRGEPLNWKYRVGCDGRSCNNSYRAVLLAIFEPNSLWPPKHTWLKILKSCHISASPLLSTEPSQNIDKITSLQEDYSTVLKMLQ